MESVLKEGKVVAARDELAEDHEARFVGVGPARLVVGEGGLVDLAFAALAAEDDGRALWDSEGGDGRDGRAAPRDSFGQDENRDFLRLCLANERVDGGTDLLVRLLVEGHVDAELTDGDDRGTT